MVAAAALARGTETAPDTRSYVEPARSLLASGALDSDGAPELVRTPGYPLLLAVGERLGVLAPVTLALQVALGVLTVWMVARLAREIGARARVARLAAALYAVEPLSLSLTGKLLTETLFTAVLVAMLLVLARWARGGRTRLLAAAGALLAAACFVRPVLYYAVPVLAVTVAAIGWRRDRRTRCALTGAALFLGMAGAPLLAWQARNARVAGYGGFSAIADLDLFYYRAAGVVALRTGRALESVQAEWMMARGDRLRQAGRAARGRERAAQYHEMRARACAVLAGDPAAVLRVTAAGAVRILFGLGTTDWAELIGVERRPRAHLFLTAMLAAYLLLVLALAARGLRVRGWKLSALPVFVVSIYLVAVTAGPGAYSRFRHPVMPPLCVLAAAGAGTRRRRPPKQPPDAAAPRHPSEETRAPKAFRPRGSVLCMSLEAAGSLHPFTGPIQPAGLRDAAQSPVTFRVPVIPSAAWGSHWK